MGNNTNAFLFLFLDGVGLGPNDPNSNPLALAEMPNISSLIQGKKLTLESLGSQGTPIEYQHATLLGLDATLGVDGHPQSATGQATLLTGINISKELGYHFGPWPNTEIRNYLTKHSIFHTLKHRGYKSALLNAYPQSYFERIESGRRLPGAVAMSVLDAGIPLKTTSDLIDGQALSADFTGEGWHNKLGTPNIPVLNLHDAGVRMAQLSLKYDFSFFEFWISDYAGHRADMEESCHLMETFDTMFGGLFEEWDEKCGLIFITSDHGNIENNNTRGHTTNLVPGLVIGNLEQRREFTLSLYDLADVSPAILRFLERNY
jgi:2,3-bisphosphoglycerate-independent phosphoglycerate mutase